MRISTLLLVIAGVFMAEMGWGQSIFDNPITGTNPNTSNPYTTGQTVNANITATGIGRGSGITGSNANDRYNANGWNQTMLDANDYFTLTLTPNATFKIDFVSFVYTGQASGTGPTSVALRSSIDGFGSNIGTATITGTTISLSGASFQGITSAIEFRFYAWGGTGGTYSINSFTFNGTVGATAGTSTITAGAGAEPASISSLVNTQGAAALNFDIDVNDVGGDAKDTRITQMVFAQGTGNDVTTWTNVIAGAELTDGTNTLTGTINAGNITFSGINTATLGLVTESTTKNYTLKVWLKTDFGSEKLTADGKNLEFRIQNSNITVDPTGSGFATGQDQNSGASNNAIDVTATALAYVVNAAATVQTNAAMSPAVTVSANDANGNRDLGWVTDVTMTSTGTLTGSPVTGTLSMGLATFSTLTHTVAQTARQLTAASVGLTSIVSSNFDVTAVLTNTIAAGAGVEPATISSIINTQGSAVLNFDILITDDGATPGNDNLDTRIQQMVFTQGTGNDIGTWTTVIAGAELSDGTNTMTGTIGASTITFSAIDVANLGLVADNGTKTYTLKVWLNTDFGAEKLTGDGKNLVFRIQQSNITVDPTGSGFATGQDQNSGSSNNAIDVTATVLAYVQNASTVNKGASMTPAVTVSANDVNGNRDLGWATAIEITSTGTLTGSPVTGTLSMGLATFNSLTHTVAETGRELTAASTGTTSSTSAMFNVNEATLATDYFRTVASGRWNASSTWESSSDNMTWIPATLAPISTANTITIRTPNVVDITVSVSADQLTIEAGATLDLKSVTLTVANGSEATDMTVSGILINSNGVITATGVIVVENGGKYQHNWTTSSGAVPTATWNSGSTCEIIAVNSGITGLTQDFYHFIWNNTGQGGTGLNLLGGLRVIKGDFTIVSTGTTGDIRLIANGTFTNLTVDGNLILQNGSDFILSSGTTPAPLLVKGNIDICSTCTISETGAGNGSITLNGTSQQTINANDAVMIGTIPVTVNNAAGVALLSDFNISDNLILTSGQLRTNGFVVELTTNSTSITSSATNFVCTCSADGNTASTAGGLRRRVPASTTVLYPVGPLSNTYMPASIIAQASSHSTDFFTVRTEPLQSNGVAVPDPTKCIQYQWIVDEGTPGSANAKLKFQWVASAEGSNFNPAVQPEIGRWSGTSFTPISVATYAAGDPSFTSVSNFTAFSPFVVATGSALPVELISFNATPRNKEVELNWATGSELNNDFFAVERSDDGIDYTELTQVRGAGTTQLTSTYNFMDKNPLEGTNYYRLRQVDFNKEFSYSPIRVVKMESGSTFQVFPTLVTNTLTVRAAEIQEDEVIVEIISASTGILIDTRTMSAGSNELLIATDRLPAGTYMAQLKVAIEVKHFMFIKN